ncbi:MAG TPA: hypothetical protein VJR02_17545 [Pyrinomonadaceae bacterium]|nr:hypothetical protein [Pyrinomonadaceae bacterium]
MERELTAQAFIRLLERLGDDEEQAAQNYEDLRHTLIRTFEWRGAPFPEEHADETLNRLARKLDEGVEIRNLRDYTAGGNLVSGQLDPADERVLFHLVNIDAPGQVTFAFSVKATDAKAGAKFAVLEPKGTFVFPALEVQGGESVSKPITFDKAKTITILVQPIKFPDNGGRGTYSVQLSGPVTVVIK